MDFNDLLAAGLGETFPTLTNKSHADKMFQRMKVLRTAYFRGPATPLITYLPESKRPARCFGPAWEGTVIVALITSRKRDLGEDRVDGLFSDLRSHGTLLPQSSSRSDASSSFAWVNDDVKEGVQFVKLLRLLRDREAAHATMVHAAVVKQSLNKSQKPTVWQNALREDPESDYETSAK